MNLVQFLKDENLSVSGLSLPFYAGRYLDEGNNSSYITSGKHYHRVVTNTTMIEELQQAGLSPNEAKLYETLLNKGESGVSSLSIASGIHRRNVYDTLARLVEKGLAYEVLGENESRYQAVHPQKLDNILMERRTALQSIMPKLESLYEGEKPTEGLLVYKGVEGWKNYIRDVLRLGEDLYTVGAKGAWSSPALLGLKKQFREEAALKGIKVNQLWDAEARNQTFTTDLPGRKAYLPKEYSTDSALDIFADRVVILSGVERENFDEDTQLTVIVNRAIADAFRTWWEMMYHFSEKFEVKLKKKAPPVETGRT